MQLSFWGAAGTVTGSKYLLTLNQKKILIDCGLFQGEKTIRDRNWEPLPISPAEIDAVILTHAHLDHSGYLPVIVKNGFTGPIYSTPGTKELSAILLADSGKIQEEDAYFANKHGYTKHTPALPLYTQEEALKTMKLFYTVPFEQVFRLFDGDTSNECRVTFSRAAHILGSAFIQIEHQGKTIVFSGDLGRAHDPIMREPSFMGQADYVVIESTYGDRLHDPEPPHKMLAQVINETASRGGTVLIPAFAVGRAQSIINYLAELKENSEIPSLPIYLDSPMAESVTDIYTRHLEEHCLDKDQCRKLNADVIYVKTIEESKRLDASAYPSIIISASGMATGGRVLHHLKALAPNPRNTILFTGYQAKGTLGRHLLEGDQEVKIHGKNVEVRAAVKVLDNLSAHSDYAETLTWLGHLKQPPRQVFITHGELESSLALKQKIEEKFGWPCLVPTHLQNVKID